MNSTFTRMFTGLFILIVFFGLIQGYITMKFSRQGVDYVMQSHLDASANQLKLIFTIQERKGSSYSEILNGENFLNEFYPFIQNISFYDNNGVLINSLGPNITEEDKITIQDHNFAIPRRTVERENGDLLYYIDVFPQTRKMRDEMPYMRWINIYIRHSLSVILITLPIALIFAYFYAVEVSKDTKSLSRSLIKLADGIRHVDFPVGRTNESRQIIDAAKQLQQQMIEKETLQIRRVQELTHDLKSPLAGLFTQLESVELGVLELSEERFKHIYGELGYINNLVDNMTEVYHLEDDKVYYSPVSIRVTLLFNLLIDRYRPMAAENGKIISTQLKLGNFFADFNLIMRALGNLISNAVIHGSGEEILITVYEENGIVVIEVLNEGQILEEDLPYILNRYWSKGSNGSGLGLCISDLIARKHGGFLKVNNLEDGYVLFTLSIPQP